MIAQPTDPLNQYGWNEYWINVELTQFFKLGWGDLATRAVEQFNLELDRLITHALRESGSFWHGHPDGQIVGDHGNAFGPMQINIATHGLPAGITNIQDVAQNFIAGAYIIADFDRKLGAATANAPLTEDLYSDAWFCTYNAGVGGTLRGLAEANNPDLYSHHQDYGKDCVARLAVVQKFLSLPNGTIPDIKAGA